MKAIIVILALCGMVHADTIKGKFPACISEELHEQLTSAINHNDKASLAWLFDNGCFLPKAGLHVMRISGFLVLKVRAIVGKESIVFWTVMENVER